MAASDPRRRVPSTDTVLTDSRLVAATDLLGASSVKAAVHSAQERVRQGELPPEAVADAAVATLPGHATHLRPVVNATGVVLHTNLGRAPLSPAAIDAMAAASGYVDVEFDVESGDRARRGRATLDALRDAVPAAEDVLVVNNGAAALVLATTALAGDGEVLVSRGEMVEIGDGFRLPDLIASTGARLREVGTTNRTNLDDYATALRSEAGAAEIRAILKVHPSNFRVEGFTSAVSVDELAELGPPVIVDVGSGLLTADPLLPDEPDMTSAVRSGAAVVTASGDKLLGGPQAGLLLGRAEVIQRLRRHPLARALRVDKLTLAALEATLRNPRTPTEHYLHADVDALRRRAEVLAAALEAEVVPSAGAVGGGGAPGLELPGWAVALPTRYAEELRRQVPAVVGRIEHDRLMLDLRCVPEHDDDTVRNAVLRVRNELG